MKNTYILIAVITLLISSCTKDRLYVIGEGEVVTKEIELNSFDKVVSLGNHNVIISSGTEQKVEVTGHANIIDRLEREVRASEWAIELEEGNYRNADLTIQITIPYTNSAELLGSGHIKINDFESTENVNLRIDGSGEIEIHKNSGCENLNVRIYGSGNVISKNSFEDLKYLNVDIIGSGNYVGDLNTSEDCDINIEGSGRSDVSVINELIVKITGSGVVNYRGAPNSIISDISGSGKLNQI